VRLVTIRTQLLSVVARWREQYARELAGETVICGRAADVLAKLQALDLNTATADDVANIIGNRSWAEPKQCDECGRESDRVVELGDEPDYESRTCNLCLVCVGLARELIGTPADVGSVRTRENDERYQ
jgi:hypothetical protein